MPRHLIRARSGDLSSNHDPSFVQQGEVDWVSLSKALVSLSVGTLKRLSAAGVQEMTYVSALQLGTRFQLQDVGYKRVEEAIEKTSYAPAIGRVAYFGFGYRSFVHLLADFQCGVKFIALCATLQEAHGEDLAARVMSSLWAAVGYPEEYQPSNAQFKCLARACAGVFAETKFLEVVGIMLGSYRRFRQAGKLPETSDPAEIAAVLQGLFDISKGTRTRMEVIGGAECSFIAAIAYWLFELKIQVDDSQGNTLFTSSSESDEAQVYIVYKDAEQLKSVAITRSTYILRDPSEIFRYLPDSELRVIRTRVPWGVCLHRTFGIDFEGLIKLPISLGRFLGGIARVYKALATSEPHLPWLSPGLFVGFVEEGYGQGFIDTMQRLFPELNNPALVGSMEQAVKHTVHNADSGIEEAMLTFQSHCQCSGCRSHGQRMELHEERLCLLGLAITLVELVTALAATERVPQLMLTEKGIFNVYEDSIKYLRGHDITQPLQTLAKALRLHESPGSRAHMTPALMMARTISLFTGYESSKATLETNNYRTAVAENGICVYMDCLESMTARPELLRRLHVIPGHIERGTTNAIYDSIWDCAPTFPPLLEPICIEPIAMESGLTNRSTSSDAVKSAVLVDEPSGPGQLTLYYRLSTPQGQVFVQPGLISCQILLRSGLISCSCRNCDERMAQRTFAVVSGWSLTWDTLPAADNLPDKIVFVWNHTSGMDVARLLSLQMQHSTPSAGFGTTGHSFVRRDECIPCCVRAASLSAESQSLGKLITHIL